MLTELMTASAHDPLVGRCCDTQPDRGEPRALPLHAGMSANEVAEALLRGAARRELAATRLW